MNQDASKHAVHVSMFRVLCACTLIDCRIVARHHAVFSE